MTIEDVDTKNYVAACSGFREALRDNDADELIKWLSKSEAAKELIQLALVGAHVMSSMTPVQRRDVVMAALLGTQSGQEV